MDILIARKSAAGLVAVLAMWLLLPGCGKKGMPKPPGAAPLPAIDNLKSTTRGEVLWLTWSIPEKMGDRASDVVGFVVYRSKLATTESPCENCPVVFRKLGQIPVEGTFSGGIGKKTFSYEDVLEKDHRYVYQISTLISNGQESPGSNPVTVNF